MISKTLLIAAMSLSALAQPSLARAKSGVNVRVDLKNLVHEEVRVPKGEQRREDVVTSKAIIVEGSVNGDCVSLGGAITVSGEVVGDVASLGGPTTISGSLIGDVASMGGPVRVSGSIKGNVASMGGDVILEPKAVVEGDVALMGGRLVKADGAELKGEVTQLDLSFIKKFASFAAKHGGTSVPEIAQTLSPAYRLLGYAAFLAFLVGIGAMLALLTAFLPAQVEQVADAIKADFWKSAGIGALIVMLIFPGLFLMTVSILGIPIIPIALLLLCAGVLMALASFGRVVTERLYASLQKPLPSTWTAVGLGYLLLTSLLIVGKLLKLAGGVGSLLGGIFVLTNLMLLSCALLVGLGAVWTTRLGSRPVDINN